MKLSRSSWLLAVKVAKTLIRDVGQIPSCVEQMAVAIHYRRALTDAEFAKLPAAWCAIPPAHEAGRGIFIEANT